MSDGGAEGAGEGGKKHERRKRYRGTHPRHFSEKYKEHRAAEYPEDIARILARGATPAGSHRPICVDEILACLDPRPGETGVDATLGHGGHARAFLSALAPGGRLYGFDRDADELSRTAALIDSELGRRGGAGGGAEGAAAGYDTASQAAIFIPVHASFAELGEVLEEAGVGGVDFILADLGLSSMQIDDPERGFSFKRRGPLDMRMDRSRGPSAAEWLAMVGEAELARAIRDNADESEAAAVARAICLRRGRLSTTRDLAEAICAAFPALDFDDPGMRKILTRIFQAIRIEVNGEFAALDALLASIPSCLNPGGRVAILSFHSGEEGRVERAFAAGLASGAYASVSAEATRPSREERSANPRSSSARLRWAVAPGERGSVAYGGIHG
ncbi:MAG TPA: 16S rRNA (cytosine(1402)-N(4))-methyltransferase RsmH [Rectinemataceae bacterium]|nr:16S rRNA (cytosine(1402)-N(4))-methyltransferase RsmH [Rectinemataceae bacterium]